MRLLLQKGLQTSRRGPTGNGDQAAAPMPSRHSGVTRTSPDAGTRSALALYFFRSAAAPSPTIITTFVSASAITHDCARTVAPAISVAGSRVAGWTVVGPRYSEDSNGLNERPEDA